jgi:chemotaxis protein CheX
MDVEFINPFLGATIRVLKTMASTEARPGKPYVKKGENASGDVSGIIGITGDTKGSLSITFSADCIKAVVKNMLGEECQEINDEIKDAVGEITNMISGDARRELSQKGRDLNAAIPTVVSGPSHSIRHISSGPCIAIPFETHAGPFVVEVSFNR